MARNERIDKDTDNRQFLIFNIVKLVQNSIHKWCISIKWLPVYIHVINIYTYVSISDGAKNCGLFCTFTNAVSSMKMDETADIFQLVRTRLGCNMPHLCVCLKPGPSWCGLICVYWFNLNCRPLLFQHYFHKMATSLSQMTTDMVRNALCGLNSKYTFLFWML
jgi:hypothetical protein